MVAEFEAFRNIKVRVDVAEYLEVAVLNCTEMVVKGAEMAILLITT
jgi:hypothetical protein